MFEEPLYTRMGLTLAGVTVNYEPVDFLFEVPVRVDVVMARPAGQEVHPDIAIQIDNPLTGAIDKNFRVIVGFIEIQQTA